MATVVFYEKPGCRTNARQRRLLEAAGHVLLVRNLLTEAWTAGELLSYFGDMPVTNWFNPAAPTVKSGSVDPERADSEAALALMLADPLLIRRPLLEMGGRRRAGFTPDVVAWLGLSPAGEDEPDPQSCAHAGRKDTPGLPACPAPARHF